MPLEIAGIDSASDLGYAVSPRVQGYVRIGDISSIHPVDNLYVCKAGNPLCYREEIFRRLAVSVHGDVHGPRGIELQGRGHGEEEMISGGIIDALHNDVRELAVLAASSGVGGENFRLGGHSHRDPRPPYVRLIRRLVRIKLNEEIGDGHESAD